MQCTVHDTSPSRPNKLLPLKVDCYTQDETSEHSKTHQASRNPIRTKTNIWGCKLSLCHPPSWPLLQFETLLDDWTNKSHHFECSVSGVCVCGGGGGRLVIISLSCYSMSQQGARGVGWGPGWKGKGLVGFCWKHNWHGLGDTVRQIVPCLSVCIHRGPCNVSLNKEPRPLRRCLCSLCGSATQQVANLTITAQHRYN